MRTPPFFRHRVVLSFQSPIRRWLCKDPGARGREAVGNLIGILNGYGELLVGARFSPCGGDPRSRGRQVVAPNLTAGIGCSKISYRCCVRESSRSALDRAGGAVDVVDASRCCGRPCVPVLARSRRAAPLRAPRPRVAVAEDAAALSMARTSPRRQELFARAAHRRSRPPPPRAGIGGSARDIGRAAILWATACV